MDNEPEETQQFSAQEPTKPSLRQRARDRWSGLSDRMRLIAIIVAGLLIFIVGFGSGLAAHGGGGHHRGGPCYNERFERHHHGYRDCYNQPVAPTTTAPATTTTTPAATTTAAPATP